jgi:hypothetical protein
MLCKFPVRSRRVKKIAEEAKEVLMGIKKVAATAMLAIAATGIATATAHGESQVAEPVISRVDDGMAYTAGLTEDHTGVVTKLESGRFDLTGDGSAVTVTGPDGSKLAQLPMSFQASGQQFRLTPEIDSAGKTLTLRSADRPGVPVDVAQFRENAAKMYDASIRDVADPNVQSGKDVVLLLCLPGLVIGAVVGALIGIFVGVLLLGIGLIVTVPAGIIIGAAIGCAIL